MEKQRSANITAEEVSLRKNRNLAKSYSLWADDTPFDETNYRDKIKMLGRYFRIDCIFKKK